MRNDADFVFFNQPRHASGAVIHEGRVGASESIAVEISTLPDEIDKVVLAASISDGTFGAVGGLTLRILDLASGEEEHRFEDMGATMETALVIGELYRRSGAWKFRAVGQGWATGLAGLATDYGVNVEEPSDAAPPGSAPPSVAPPAPPVAGPAPVLHEPIAPRIAEPVYPAGPVRAQEPSSEPEFRPRRVTAERTPAKAVTLGEGQLTLTINQSAVLGEIAKDQVWLRATQIGKRPAPGVDLSVLTFDRFGAPMETAYYEMHSTPSSGVRLGGRPITSTPHDTAFVDLRLDSLPQDTTALVAVASSYRGESLAAAGVLVTELIGQKGTVLIRTECPAPTTTAALLVSLTRTDDGGWFLTALATPAEGRTALGLVGAGTWALSA